jgi:serine/threonine protein kinase
MLINNTLWNTSATSSRGTLRWKAPEMITETSPHATKASDIYALAMTFYVSPSLICSSLSKWRHFQEVITGHLPFFNTAGDGKVILDVIKGKRPERPSASFPPDDIWTLIQSCWVEDVDARPGISSILSQLPADCCEDEPRYDGFCSAIVNIDRIYSENGVSSAVN